MERWEGRAEWEREFHLSLVGLSADYHVWRVLTKGGSRAVQCGGRAPGGREGRRQRGEGRRRKRWEGGGGEVVRECLIIETICLTSFAVWLAKETHSPFSSEPDHIAQCRLLQLQPEGAVTNVPSKPIPNPCIRAVTAIEYSQPVTVSTECKCPPFYSLLIVILCTGEEWS